MAKLLPPLLEGIVPAFYQENGKVRITIPFSMNRAVSAAQVKGLALKIKAAQSSSYLYTAIMDNDLYFKLDNSPWVDFLFDLDSSEEEKNFIENRLKVGQFYKFQIAYIDESNEIGYYSTVATGKYTTKPNLYINGLDNNLINNHIYNYIGCFETQDSTERVYSYNFDIYDSHDKIIASSGEQLHNSSNDTELKSSYDKFLFSKDLELNKPYKIKYTVTTNNKLTISSPRYRLIQRLTIDPEIKATLSVNNNYNNGYVDVKLIGIKNEDDLEDPVSGAFLLTRACEDSNYTIWDEISRFKLSAQIPSRQLWRDYTTEQGKHYIYSLQQYNDSGLYSNRMLSNTVYSDFEDAFLFDGNKQLKIKYNPKVSSFKADVLESKVDTIGSKHPFIFRNGRVYYREFPISGLISYYMDEENLFMSKENIVIEEKTTNLVSENLAKERDFKMKVYEWLTNGQPKLFRSPTEGNFIIRLMNASLTPNDTLGRMLHTFNATAYEIAEYNYENLNKFDFIHLKDPEVAQLRWETIKLNDRDINGKLKYKINTQLNSHLVYTVRFTDMIPGDQFRIIFRGSENSPMIIQIGVTGSYYIDTGMPITSIELIGDERDPILREGSITYSYYSIQSNIFDKITNVSVFEVPVRQFIGYHDVIKEIEYVYDKKNDKWYKNPKIDIIEFYNLYASKRTNEKIIEKDNIYYQDKDCKISLPDSKDIFTLYQVGTWEATGSGSMGPGYGPNRPTYKFTIKSYKDFFNDKEYLISSEVDVYQPFIEINNSQINLNDTQVFTMKRPGKLNKLISGNGTIIEVSYQVRNIDYNIEYNETAYKALYDARVAYENAEKELQECLESLDEENNNSQILTDEELEELDTFRKNISSTYNTYILELVKAQKEEKKAEGLI